MKEVRANADQPRYEEEQVNKSQEAAGQPKTQNVSPSHPFVILVSGWLKAHSNPYKSGKIRLRDRNLR
jgi:hypothetical protein